MISRLFEVDLAYLYPLVLGRWLDLAYYNSYYQDLEPGYSTRLLTTPVGRFLGRTITYVARKAIQYDESRARRLLTWIEGEIFTEYSQRRKLAAISMTNYVRLYQVVRRLKPVAVLECGAGLSTTAIALSLKHNDEECGVSGKVVSMEEIPEWFEHTRSLIPQQLEKYVELVLSPVIERECTGQRGTCYRDVPEKKYELVFVDGPRDTSPIDGRKVFNMDFIYVAERNPLAYGLIDHRLSTVVYLRKLLKRTHDVIYNPISDFGCIYPKVGRRYRL